MAMRRTRRWYGSPSATTDPKDLPGPARTGWARPTIAGSTARQEPGVTAGLHHPAGPGGEHRGGQLIGDTRLTFRSGGGDGVDQPFGGGLLGAEVAGRTADRHHQQPRPQHLSARHHIIHRRDHAFEEPGVTGRVGHGDVHLRAAGLGLAPAQAAPHPGLAGRRRTGDHPVGAGDRDLRGGGQPGGRRGGDGRPVHAPDRQRPCGHVLRRARTDNRTPPIRPQPATGTPAVPAVIS